MPCKWSRLWLWRWTIVEVYQKSIDSKRSFWQQRREPQIWPQVDYMYTHTHIPSNVCRSNWIKIGVRSKYDSFIRHVQSSFPFYALCTAGGVKLVLLMNNFRQFQQPRQVWWKTMNFSCTIYGSFVRTRGLNNYGFLLSIILSPQFVHHVVFSPFFLRIKP